MPQPKPSQAFRDMLVERNIALWQASHYTTFNSKSPGRPTAKDPVMVTLATPEAVDRFFYGRGLTVDDAIANALATNPGLNFNVPGLVGATARLENEMHALNVAFWKHNSEVIGEDYDIPF